LITQKVINAAIASLPEGSILKDVLKSYELDLTKINDVDFK
jgi:hypothetical protein